MTPEIATCLTILGLAVIVFAWDRVPADVVALGVMLGVIATGLLPPDKAFAGFSSDTVMMILGLLVMSAGLIQTGVVEIAGRFVFDMAGRNPAIFLPVIMVSVAVLSAFMSNTAATAFFVPLVIGYAAKIGASPSRFLLPLAFASILTSSVTLISTSTNLVVSDLFANYQQPPMGMFEMAPVGIPIAILGVLYVWAVGVRLIPQRDNQKADEKIGERTYQADVLVTEDSPLVGKTIEDAKLTSDTGMAVAKLVRGKETTRGQARAGEATLAAGDELLHRRPARGPPQDQGHQGARVQGRRASGRSGPGRGGRKDHRGGRAAAALATDRTEPAQPGLQGTLRAGGAGHPPGRPAARDPSAPRACAWATCCCCRERWRT